MSIAAGVLERLDEIGKPAWIALMVLGFALFWPLGLATLAFLLWSGRMGCSNHRRLARWQELGGLGPMERRWSRWGREPTAMSSGNRAFDDYRAQTLRRLEEEQREFHAFLERLRFARDKAEFDQFLAERRQRPGTAGEAPEHPAEP